MSFSEEQVMLTLAALTYRGFHDPFTGALHEDTVREALLDGLGTFDPVRDQWELVWGPATMRQVPLKSHRTVNLFDWNAMYVVRNRTLRNQYAIAIRGTNPIESQDWLFGDLWVGTTVQWPYGSGKEAVSTSTALGLASLQSMRSGPPSGTSLKNAIAGEARDALHAIAARSQNALKSWMGQTPLDRLAHVEQHVKRIAQHLRASVVDIDAVKALLQRLQSAALVEPQELRPKLQLKPQEDGKLDLLTFLKAQADDTSDALDVLVTGHSKGGALAPAVSLWLKEALASDETECWDKKRNAQVRCYAFAGPTPGNAAFADRVDAVLDQDCHQRINSNDVVPHAFDIDDLAQIPPLYGDRTAILARLVNGLIENVRPLAYRHPANGVKKFSGSLDSSRSFPVELIHQHLDAYLAELGLRSEKMNAFTFFI